MFDEAELKKIEREKGKWEQGTLKRALERFGVKESPNRFYTPLDTKDHRFLEDVGFPEQYPFTSANYPSSVPGSGPQTGGSYVRGGGGLARSGRYSGYGTAEDTRDYYLAEASRGSTFGPSLAFHLPTQLGYDSDEPSARGEVGKVGVAVDTLRDMEVIYEAFTGPRDLDKISSYFVMNGAADICIAMYAALAEKRGIPLARVRGVVQNDILKEFAARGMYIFPPRQSMRMTRDSIVWCTKHMPAFSTMSISGYHIREAGATGPQTLAFTLAHAMAYVQLGVDAGLKVDDFVSRFTFLNLSGGMEMFKEIALQRAARRMWAKIMKERFGAKDPRSWLYRTDVWARQGCYSLTAQRPLNNLARTVIGGIAGALSGGNTSVDPPYDEALGLGWSLEATQLAEDASRILQYEARLSDVTDPLAGSYYVEALTDQVEQETWDIINKIEAMGGALAAIEKGFQQQEIARSAYQYQKEVETGQRTIVGVNRFTGENELEVLTARLVALPYDPAKRDEAEKRQLANLAKVKRERDNAQVQACLRRLEDAARDETVNLLPLLLEAVKAYATIGEMCGVLRQVFGEYTPFTMQG